MKGLENRMDIFKLSFMVCQLIGLVLLAIRILLLNRNLSAQFFNDVRNRVVQINRAKGIDIV